VAYLAVLPCFTVFSSLRTILPNGPRGSVPGIYGLNAFSLDERISRDYLVSSRPDLVLSIIDSTNLQRNLYLTLELIEMGVNVVVVLNMQDELEAQGISIDTEGMARTLDAPVLLISALKRTGIQELKSEIIKNGKEGLPKIERKFAELKRYHGMAAARYWGLTKMSIQNLMTAITCNLKRMVKLIFEQNGKVFVPLETPIGIPVPI